MVSKLLEKLPKNRFQTAAEALEFLKAKVRPVVFGEVVAGSTMVAINPFATPPGATSGVPGVPVPAAMAATGPGVAGAPPGTPDLGFSWQDGDVAVADLGFTTPQRPAAKLSGDVAQAPEEAATETPEAEAKPADTPGFFTRMWRAVFG